MAVDRQRVCESVDPQAVALAFAARARRDPAVERLWVFAHRHVVQLWLLIKDVDAPEERRLYGLLDGMYERFPDTNLRLVLISPRNFDPLELDVILPPGSVEVSLASSAYERVITDESEVRAGSVSGVLDMPESAYDEIAEWYDGWVGSRSMHDDPFYAPAEALMGDVRGLRICDLACGQGRVARYLAEQGARVVGVDISAKLLEIALRHEAAEPRAIEYRQADAQTLDGFDDSSFDGVVCYMALMDIPSLHPTLQSVARVLLPGGWFVFVIIHPCYNPAPSGELMTTQGIVRTVSGYFTEGYWRSDARTGPPGKVGSYHRTLSTYVNGLNQVGLTIKQIAEPRLSGIAAERRPVWTEVPAALVVRCRKAPTASDGTP